MDPSETSPERGLTQAEAQRRLAQYGANEPSSAKKRSPFLNFLAQFKSPILLLLIFAAVVSGFLGDVVDSITILAIVISASVLSFYQEFRADASVAELLKLVQVTVSVRRDGRVQSVPVAEVVPGDIVELQTGNTVPADGKAISSEQLTANESALTGESMPVEKKPNAELLAGSHIQSGQGVMLVVTTGSKTKFGDVASHLQSERPEGEFHRGIRKYGYLLMEFTLALTMAVFAINLWFHKPLVESFLFSLALAVGLTPQLLPAIMSLTLSKGARHIAGDKVVVKRLEAIEDFGSMDVLCSDKTGTLTEGAIDLDGAFDTEGKDSEEVKRLAVINAKLLLESFSNPIDEAIAKAAGDIEVPKAIGQVPYDFFRKRASVVVELDGKTTMITKGAVAEVLKCCTGDVRSADALFEKWSAQGYRVLAVATKEVDAAGKVDSDEEQGMALRGFLIFGDPLRPDTVEMVQNLRNKGILLKVLTGDNKLVAAQLARDLKMPNTEVLTGKDLEALPVASLARRIKDVDVFAELDPVQKERLIVAIRKAGHVVGYIGDGINDAPSMHAADVGISVSGATDVAKEAADIVMLERGLAVINRGVEEGRRIFANTLKYIYITTSANFGNMFSMAAASLFLPFLPLLPKQILLNNFVTDIPAMTIATDTVDPDLVEKPRRWNLTNLRNFMLIFGLQSSVFDLLSFFVLKQVLVANQEQFRTGWFIESAVSEILILLVIRTRKPFFKSKPAGPLLWSCVGITALILALPYMPFSSFIGFVPLPPIFLAVILGILVLYVVTAELLKKRFEVL